MSAEVAGFKLFVFGFVFISFEELITVPGGWPQLKQNNCPSFHPPPSPPSSPPPPVAVVAVVAAVGVEKGVGGGSWVGRKYWSMRRAE